MKLFFLLFAFEFLGSKIEINPEPNWQDLHLSQTNSQGIQVFYRQLLTNSPDKPLVKSLIKIKVDYQMSDWVFYLLIRNAVDQLFPYHSLLEKDILLYTLLNESGYQTRAGLQNQRLNVYVAIDQEIYEQTITIIEEISFVCLNRKDENYVPGLILNPIQGRKIFRFDLQWESLWPAQRVTKNMSFEFEDSLYQFTIQANLNLDLIMKDHPLVEESLYIQKELSHEVGLELKEFFKKHTQNMSREKAVKFLLAFTRSAFEYKEDQEAYRRNRPMIAEELFVQRYSDCEDRTALFYQLNKMLFQLPIAVISFPDHLSVAIVSNEIIPDVDYKLNLEGKTYYHADPTGPEGWYKIGHFPGNLKGYIPEILILFEPQ